MLPYKQAATAPFEGGKGGIRCAPLTSPAPVLWDILKFQPSISLGLPRNGGRRSSNRRRAFGVVKPPRGRESTHCVLSGHRGLPSAKLFTNLDKLVTGDKFIVRVLDEVLTYEVDQILIVEPTDVSTLMIESGKDLCTLVTCTPYGVNSHRLLVRGHRVENQEDAQAVRVTSDAIQIEPLIVAPAVALPMLLVLLVILLASGGKTKSAGGKKNAKTE